MDYEISIDKVVEMFSALAGDGSEEKGAVFCRSAALAVTDWLDPKKDLWAHDYGICYAAASMAYYRFTLNVTASTDMKAGDITLRENGEERVAYAERLLKEAMSDISPLLRSKRFAFMKTEG